MTTFHTTPWQFSSCNTTNLYLVACQFSILYHGKFYLVTWQFFILQHDKSLSCSMAILHFHCTMTIFSDSMPITDRWHELSSMLQHCNPYTHHNMAIFPLITLPQHGNFYLIAWRGVSGGVRWQRFSEGTNMFPRESHLEQTHSLGLPSQGNMSQLLVSFKQKISIGIELCKNISYGVTPIVGMAQRIPIEIYASIYFLENSKHFLKSHVFTPLEKFNATCLHLYSFLFSIDDFPSNSCDSIQTTMLYNSCV